MLEKNASAQEKENGADLADYLLKYELEQFASFNGVIKTERTRLLDDIIERNPAIKRMIYFKIVEM